jgi:hypothetical protein
MKCSKFDTLLLSKDMPVLVEDISLQELSGAVSCELVGVTSLRLFIHHAHAKADWGPAVSVAVSPCNLSEVRS